MEEFDISKDFWKEHPQFKHLDGFRQLYATNPPKDSSRLMWYLKYCFHPQSIISNMRDKERSDYMEKSILDDIGFVLEHKEEIDELSELYIKVIDSPLDRIIRTVTEKLSQKETFLKEKTYDLETFEDLDKALLSLDKQYSMLEVLMNKRQQDKESKKKGDEEMSESDRGML